MRARATSDYSRREILEIRHHSLFTPRDFDLSPYFEVVKPTLKYGFDYKSVIWSDRQPDALPAPAAAGAGPSPEPVAADVRSGGAIQPDPEVR